MKKIFLFGVLIIAAFIGAQGQIKNPVKWNYSAIKMDAKTYEVTLTATIDKGWHIYSQMTPEGGPVPTAIKFNKNPLVTLQGVAKEAGKLEKHYEKLFGVEVQQFSNTVNFVQIVTLKSPVSTNVSGSIEFMVCDDEQCLPPATQKFTIALK